MRVLYHFHLQEFPLFVSEIQRRAITGKPIVSGGRATVTFPQFSWNNIIFLASQLNFEKPLVDYFREKIETDVVLGIEPRTIELKKPILFAALSFGAISDQAKIAIARASARLGIATNTGEGGMLPEERKEAKLLIAQYSTGRFGVNDDYLQKADAIEIKIGQSAKAGQGGILPADKVTERIAKIRKVPVGKAIYSPPRHLDLPTPEKFKERIEEIRRIIGDKPIIIKIAANDIETDLRVIHYLQPDIIAVDGYGGGTGAAPEVMMNNFCIPTPVAIKQIKEFMKLRDMKQSLIASGGINIGAEMAKALALGANAVSIGFPAMIAMGCIYCRECHLGDCMRGISTQKPELIRNFNISQAVNRLCNYVNACNEEIKMICGAQGFDHVNKLTAENLRVMTLELAKALDIPLVGDIKVET